jgi:putative transposase
VKCFRFIAAERAQHPISLLCRVLGVSRSGFHAWLSRRPSDRALADAWLCEQIRQIHAESRQTYGARRVHAALRYRGVSVSRKRVGRLMRGLGLSGLQPKRYRRTTIRVPGVRVADDLVDRDFRPAAPNQLWCADIKYVRTWQGWLYLAAVMDCYSRRVVGWSMRSDLEAELVLEALERRRPAPGLVHHSDQGSQYVSLRFGERCREAGVHRSIGSKGDCFDNAVAESFFATLEKDLLRRRSFANRQEARTAVFDYIETFYNPIRLHSALDYRSPVAGRVRDDLRSREESRVTVTCPPKRVHSTVHTHRSADAFHERGSAAASRRERGSGCPSDSTRARTNRTVRSSR